MRTSRIHLRRRGYTLLELLLVLALLAIIALVAAPVFRGFEPGREIANVAQHVVAIARWAQTQSVSQSEIYRLNFDLSRKVYWLTVRRGAVFTLLGEEAGREFSIPSQISLEMDRPAQSDGTYIEFQPNGRCDPVFVRLAAPNGASALLGAPTATDSFSVLPADQSAAWGQHPSPIRGAHL